MIIISRSEHALSRNILYEYFKMSVLQFFWDPKYKLSSENFLNYMAKLDEDEEKDRGKKGADFIIEDMNRSTGELFRKFQLGRFMPA